MKVTTKSGMTFICDGEIRVIENSQNITTTYDGFMDIYYTCLTTETNHRQAYEQAENIHQEVFGHNRYSDYNTFRNVNHYYFKKS